MDYQLPYGLSTTTWNIIYYVDYERYSGTSAVNKTPTRIIVMSTSSDGDFQDHHENQDEKARLKELAKEELLKEPKDLPDE